MHTNLVDTDERLSNFRILMQDFFQQVFINYNYNYNYRKVVLQVPFAISSNSPGAKYFF